MFVTGGLWLASAFVITFQCAPVAYAWDKGIEGGTCINQLDFFRYVAVPNILTDVCMLVLPLPEIWNLQLSRLQKVGLTAIFLSGLL